MNSKSILVIAFDKKQRHVPFPRKYDKHIKGNAYKSNDLSNNTIQRQYRSTILYSQEPTDKRCRVLFMHILQP